LREKTNNENPKTKENVKRPNHHHRQGCDMLNGKGFWLSKKGFLKDILKGRQ
jgi:hypothetical protein